MNTTYLQLYSTLFSLAAVGLGTKQKTSKWPVSIIATLLGFAVYYQAQLYAKCLFSSIHILTCGYGWYQWLYGGKEKTLLRTSRITSKNLAILLTIGTLSTFILGKIITLYTHADLPYWDSFYATFGLIAKWMMAKKKLESWIIWIVLDILYMNICFYKGLDVFKVKYLVYVFLAIYGYFSWRRSLKQHNNKT